MSKRAILLASCLLAVSTLRCHAILYFTPAEYLGSVESSFMGAMRMPENGLLEGPAYAGFATAQQAVSERLALLAPADRLTIEKPAYKFYESDPSRLYKNLIDTSNQVFQGAGKKSFKNEKVAIRVENTPSMSKISLAEWPFGNSQAAPALRSTLRFDKTNGKLSGVWFEQKMSRDFVFAAKPTTLKENSAIKVIKGMRPLVHEVSLNVYERLAPAGKSPMILETESLIVALKPGFAPLAQQARLAAMKMALWLPRLAR
ncbi:MAG: hypothetical protein AABZ44_04085 [Elusimicrobiota bacterium]